MHLQGDAWPSGSIPAVRRGAGSPREPVGSSEGSWPSGSRAGRRRHPPASLCTSPNYGVDPSAELTGKDLRASELRRPAMAARPCSLLDAPGMPELLWLSDLQINLGHLRLESETGWVPSASCVFLPPHCHHPVNLDPSS